MVDILDEAQKKVNDAAAPAAVPSSPPPAPTVDDAKAAELVDTLIKQADEQPPATPPSPAVVAAQEGPPEPPQVDMKNAGSPPPKKKRNIGVLIATLAFLLFTVPLGAYFVSQQKQIADFRGKAAGCAAGEWECKGNCAGSDVQKLFKDTWGEDKGQAQWMKEAGCGGDGGGEGGGGNTPTPSPGGDGGGEDDGGSGGKCPDGSPIVSCVTFNCPQGDTSGDGTCNLDDAGASTGGVQSGKDCGAPSCGQVDFLKNSDWSTGYCNHKFYGGFPNCGGGGGGGGGDDGGGGGGGGHTPTPTHADKKLSCDKLKIYKDGKRIKGDELTKLKAGDAIVFAVDGTKDKKARIRVNGGAWSETETKNDKKEFVLDFTIPSGVTKFTVEAEVQGANGKWK